MFCPFATVKTQRVSVSSILATSTRERQQQKKLPRTFVKTSILSIKKNLPLRPGYTLLFQKVILITALIPWFVDLENMYIYIDENDEFEIQNHALFNI